jgi:hypothetical protein
VDNFAVEQVDVERIHRILHRLRSQTADEHVKNNWAELRRPCAARHSISARGKLSRYLSGRPRRQKTFDLVECEGA